MLTVHYENGAALLQDQVTHLSEILHLKPILLGVWTDFSALSKEHMALFYSCFIGSIEQNPIKQKASVDHRKMGCS